MVIGDQYGYSQYNAVNRFTNLDSIEWKIINKLVYSPSPVAEEIWKLLYYDVPEASYKDALTTAQKLSLISTDGNGLTTTKKIYVAPFTDDAFDQQSSFICIYFAGAKFPNAGVAIAEIAVETVVHSKIQSINGDGNLKQNPAANPNDSTVDGQLIVVQKNRATVLARDVMAVLNGIYIDGIGYLMLNQKLDAKCTSEQSLFNNRYFFGHRTYFAVQMSGVSTEAPEY
jgi:hypothetical protein